MIRLKIFLMILIASSFSQGEYETIKELRKNLKKNKISITKIEFDRRVCSDNPGENVIVTAKEDLEKIESQIIKFKKIKDISLRKSIGITEMTVFLNNNSKVEFNMFYSIYHGVIFKDRANCTYINDDFEKLIVRLDK